MATPARRFSGRSSVADDRASLEQRRKALYLRLEDGYARIEQALMEDHEISDWEELWLHLLEEYELLSDRLAEAS